MVAMCSDAQLCGGEGGGLRATFMSIRHESVPGAEVWKTEAVDKGQCVVDIVSKVPHLVSEVLTSFGPRAIELSQKPVQPQTRYEASKQQCGDAKPRQLRKAQEEVQDRTSGLSWPIIETYVLGYVLNELNSNGNDVDCKDASADPASPSRETLHNQPSAM